MTRRHIIAKLLGGLAHRVARVEALRPATVEELTADEDTLDLVAFNLMLAVQTACDVASHVIADQRLRPASSLAESFERLAQERVISAPTAAQLARAVGLRNVVAHAYHRLDVATVHAAATSGLADLEAFAREVSAWLSAHDADGA
ncbi:MAG: DUF86 domain-containing protein [Myxococcota bacterium]|nr:DUF86 domain-containing protein [Myxococcota bacterium]